MRSCAALRRQVQRLKLKQAEAPPAVDVVSAFWKVFFHAQAEPGAPLEPVSEEELAAFLQVWEEAQRAAEQRPTVEERMAEALGEEKPRPCGLRELRPDERLASDGDEQERAD
jgi:hypothetical protein